MDAALAISEGDNEAAAKTKKRYHKQRELLPAPVGRWVNHRLTILYNPAEIAAFVCNLDGFGREERKRLTRTLIKSLKDCATT